MLIDLDSSREIVEVRAWDTQATIGQLLQPRGYVLPLTGQLYLDGVAVTSATPLRHLTLLEGSVLSDRARPRATARNGWHITAIAGHDAGWDAAIPSSSEVTIGRSPEADLTLPNQTVSWQHCSLVTNGNGINVQDTGSTNGTQIDGEPIGARGRSVTAACTVTVGGVAFRIRPGTQELPAPAPGTLRNLTPAGTAPFNRPPTSSTTPTHERLRAPAAREVPPVPGLNPIAIALPLVVAVGLAVILGDTRYALFAALSPIMAFGMHFEHRRRRARLLRTEEARFEGALEELRVALAAACATEVARLWELAPDPATLRWRAALPSTRLWERRAGSRGFLQFNVGIGDVPWEPPLELDAAQQLDKRVRGLRDSTLLTRAPVIADLSGAGVIGIVGDRNGCMALARSLVVQAAVQSGPADLTIAACCDPGRELSWDWAGWLPHTRRVGDSQGRRWLANSHETSNAMLRSLRGRGPGVHTPDLLLVIDSEDLTEGSEAPARELLSAGKLGAGTQTGEQPAEPCTSGIVIAATTDQLPAACTTVVEIGHDASANVGYPPGHNRIESATIAGLSAVDAEETARLLARFDDPELRVPGAALPTIVRLPELLGTGRPSAEDISALWETTSGPSTPVGIGAGGTFSIDLVADGPHGLVGGTTGSGKSEFLRTLIAGLAARSDPTALNFILIDFKGGAAFSACERLPHTIGTISNLDAQLADRALRALEAELERRQRLFAAAGDDVDSLSAYLSTLPEEPLPRLVLVIDEFAMLAKDQPDLLASLVAIATVGRTLGVHMILATQRPAGVVTEDILANTNLRVALRVQSREDSMNVVGVPAASSISRREAGRAFVKLGQEDITQVQTALVTGHTPRALTEEIATREVGLFGVPVRPHTLQFDAKDDDNDLDVLIDAIRAANDAAGLAPPRPVWPEPLGSRVRLAGYAHDPSSLGQRSHAAPAVGGTAGGIVRVALADEPELQTQSSAGWTPAEGNLLLIGIAGSGTSTTLASIALALAQTASPEALDILCLDLGNRTLDPLARLPHTVAYVASGSAAKERRARFLRYLEVELRRRRETTEPQRQMVVLIDGITALRDEFQDYEGQQLLDALARVYADGPGLGMHFAIAATRAGAVPAAMDEVTSQRWIFRLTDLHAYGALGIRGSAVPAPLAGRCVDLATRRQLHVATPDFGLESAVAEARLRWADAATKPEVIGALPKRVGAADVMPYSSLISEPRRFPVGIREDNLAPALLELFEGEHALVAGPPRSGKSSLLLALAEIGRGVPSEGTSTAHASESPRMAVWGIGDRRSPLLHAPLDRRATTPAALAVLVAELHASTERVLLLVDDADRVEDPDGVLEQLLEDPPTGLSVVAAGKSSELRGRYSHWTRAIRASQCGVLLQPDIDYDGDLLGVRLPRTTPVLMSVGRGYVCSGGEATLVQSAVPGSSAAGGTRIPDGRGAVSGNDEGHTNADRI